VEVKGDVLLQLLKKNQLRSGIKTFLEPIFFLFIVKFKKLWFSTPLTFSISDLKLRDLTKL